MSFKLLQIFHNSKKWQWRHNFPTWHYCEFFLTLLCFPYQFSYYSKFYLNINAGSWVLTVFFYKGLTKNWKIENTTIQVLPNIGQLEGVMDTKFSTNVSNKMLFNAASGFTWTNLAHFFYFNSNFLKFLLWNIFLKIVYYVHPINTINFFELPDHFIGFNNATVKSKKSQR